MGQEHEVCPRAREERATAARLPTAGGDRKGANGRPVRPLVGSGIYRDLVELLQAFKRLRARVNVCFPVMKPDLIPALSAVALRPVAIDPRTERTPQGRCVSADIYYDPQTAEYGLTKRALDKIAAAAGMSWHPLFTGRVDDRSDPAFRTYRACASVRNLDGTPRLLIAHKTLDLRDGGPHGLTADELPAARLHIDALCESKAMNRVIRQYAFLKGRYTAEELQKPFVIAALVLVGPAPGDDPELKRAWVNALVQQRMGATSLLFGAPPLSTRALPDLGPRTSPPPVGSAPRDHDEHELASRAAEPC